jgi:hypothetical protein
MILLSLLAGDLFTAAKIQLHKVIIDAKIFLIIVIYVLLSLRDQLSIYILKLVYTLVYIKNHEKIKEINKYIYLSFSFTLSYNDTFLALN